MNRLYVVEALMSLTGVNADHRLRVPASSLALIATAFWSIATGSSTTMALPGVDPKWLAECGKDLLAHKGESLVVAGYRQPLEVHLLAHAINAALGNIGKTVSFHETPTQTEGTLLDLVQALNAGQVETLVILGGNPAYDAASYLDWLRRRTKRNRRLAYYEDEPFQTERRLAPAAGALPGIGRRVETRRHAGSRHADRAAVWRAHGNRSARSRRGEGITSP
jgi:molybdopterin-containing oxidoreductase family iron-sulfur binding subunit